MPVLTATAVVNAVVARAKSLPDLIAGLRAINPALATQLETKPLLFSRSPWGTALAAVLGWIAARYGFGWDRDTIDLVAGISLLGGAFVMRALTKQPTAGLLTTPPATPPAVTLPPAAAPTLILLLAAGLALAACTAAQQTQALANARTACQLKAVAKAIDPASDAAAHTTHPELAAAADLGCQALTGVGPAGRPTP